MKRLLAGLMGVMLLTLGGCMDIIREQPPLEAPLSDIRIGYEAPRGDTIAPRTLPTAVLHYLSQDADYLAAAITQVSVPSGQSPAEAVLRKLLGPAPDGYRDVAPGVELQRVSNPVTVMENIAVVSLSAAARQLSLQELFVARMAIVNTLTELPNIDYVQVLVEGREEGLDLEVTMPCGALVRHAGGDIGALWNQMEVQRVQSAQQGGAQGLLKSVVLYYPAPGGRYITAQVRNIAFATTHPSVLTTGILTELAKPVGGGAPVVPNLTEALLTQPEAVYLQDTQEKIIRLRFAPELEGALLRQEVGKGVFLAMLTQTIIGFVPGVDALEVYFGQERVEALEGAQTVDWQDAAYPQGLLRRAEFRDYVGTMVPLRFARRDGQGLVQVDRAVPFRQADLPRVRLAQLFAGPNAYEGDSQLLPVAPQDVGEQDVLAVQLIDDVALVNLSQHYAEGCASLSAQEVRNSVYAMVNTLADFPQVKRVALFVEGQQVERLSGQLECRGFFYPNPGIEQTTK